MKRYLAGVLMALGVTAVPAQTDTIIKEREPVGVIDPHRYIQHNLAVPDGVEGFAQLLRQLPQGSARVEVVRAYEDGNFVFTHTQYDFFGPKAGFDIFRFEDGRIVEHWDNLQPIAETTASGRTQFDGTTAVTDREKTAANKELVKHFVDDVLLGKAPQKITGYIAPERCSTTPMLKTAWTGFQKRSRPCPTPGCR